MLSFELGSILEDADKRFGGDELYKILGPSLLTWTNNDSSRMNMVTANHKQFLIPTEPDKERYSTGFENEFGKYNRSYKTLEGSWEVKYIIPKFTHLDMEDPHQAAQQIFTVVFFNQSSNTYDMIERPVAQSLTEKFGFAYNSKEMQSYKVGDRLRNPTPFKSTAYDDHMNYCAGRNAKVYYTTASDTIEDAVVIRKGWLDSVRTVEVDEVQISVNENEAPLNLYGNSEEYKAFPDIGEHVESSLLCATRQINKHRLLYDFQEQNMAKLMDVDSEYYCTKNAKVYDINIYYNGDEPLPDTVYYSQIRKYHQECCEYANAVYQMATTIKRSGSNFTKNVTRLRSRFKNYTNPEYKWKNRDKVFSHLVIEIKVIAEVPIDLGSKVTGRYGNKGVVSRIGGEDPEYAALNDLIDELGGENMTPEEKMALRQNMNVVEDHRMPYYMQGNKRVYADILFNASGAIRRLNPSQLIETEVNFIGEQVRYLVKNAETMEKKEEYIFTFLDKVNLNQGMFFKELYDSYDTTIEIDNVKFNMLAPISKQRFIENIEENGFYIVRPPHKPLLQDDIIALYKAFPEVKPVPIYIDMFGVPRRKMMRNGVIGDQYILILKQNSNKNFSARSTFRVNRSNLPVKDMAKKTNRRPYANTPVKASEIHALLPSVSATTLAKWNLFMRSSAIARKSLDRILKAPGDPFNVATMEIRENYNNANADILAAKLKGIGIRIDFIHSDTVADVVYDDNDIHPFQFGKYTIMTTQDMRAVYTDLFQAFDFVNRKLGYVLESYPGEKVDMAWDMVFESELFNNVTEITDELKTELRDLTRGIAITEIEAINKPLKSEKATAASTNAAPKKRGRKSKKEKESIERELLEQKINPQVDPNEEIIEILEDEPEDIEEIDDAQD